MPTAYNDLVSLFDSSSTFIEKTYNSLPGFLQQLIASLPDKLTPEVIRTLGIASPVLANVGPMGLKEMLNTPGVVTNLLRSIVQILRTRFPLLMSGGVAMGLGLCVLFFGLWYCYKRGKEEREKKEQKEKMWIDYEETIGPDTRPETLQRDVNLHEKRQEESLQQQEKEGRKKDQEKDQVKGQGKDQEVAGPSSTISKRWWRST